MRDLVSNMQSMAACDPNAKKQACFCRTAARSKTKSDNHVGAHYEPDKNVGMPH
jgi:hypothetical protein